MVLSSDDLSAVWLTLQLASLTTVLLLVLATPMAWWLARTTSPWRTPISAIVALPLVLPPTVLGFYLLVALAQEHLKR
jgi:molybdate transport system permease protein